MGSRRSARSTPLIPSTRTRAMIAPGDRSSRPLGGLCALARDRWSDPRMSSLDRSLRLYGVSLIFASIPLNGEDKEEFSSRAFHSMRIVDINALCYASFPECLGASHVLEISPSHQGPRR